MSTKRIKPVEGVTDHQPPFFLDDDCSEGPSITVHNENGPMISWDHYGEKQPMLQALVFDGNGSAVAVRFHDDGTIAEIMVRKDLGGKVISDWDEAQWLKQRDGN